MLKAILVLIAFTVTACGGGFESESRPYNSGLATGEFKPVLPVFPKDEIIKQNKQNKKSEKKPAIETKFQNLKFELSIDDKQIDGEENSDAKYSAHLKGQMLVNNKVQNINIKNIYERFSKDEKEDRLELMKNSWQFVLVNKQKDFMADIRCIKSWDCKVIIAELYWYEKDTLKRRQFHIEGSIQPQRNEQIKENVEPKVIIEEEPESEEAHNHGDEIGEASEYRFITFTEEYIKPDETIYFEIAEEQEHSDSGDASDLEGNIEENNNSTVSTSPIERNIVIEAIESDASLHRPDMPTFNYALPIGSMKRLKLENFIFDFKSNEESFMYGSDIPDQSFGCPAKNKNKKGCEKGGSLENAEALDYIEASNNAIGQTPYVVYRQPNRQYGTSVLIKLLKATSEAYYNKTDKTTYVGDISLESGGKMGRHSSHQNGLDVDLRLVTIDNRNQGYDVKADNFNSLDVPGMYKFIKQIYKTAKAYDSRTEQVYSYINVIFLHNTIKKRICEQAKKDDPVDFADRKSDVFQALKRVREPTLSNPEKNKDNHTNHMHIRLNCHSNFCRDYSDKNSMSPDSNGC